MLSKHLTIYIILIGLFFMEGCAVGIISLEKAQIPESQDQLVKILGYPDRINKTSEYLQEWFYKNTFINIFNLQYVCLEYIYTLNTNGNIMGKSLVETFYKYNIISPINLSEDFRREIEVSP